MKPIITKKQVLIAFEATIGDFNQGQFADLITTGIVEVLIAASEASKEGVDVNEIKIKIEDIKNG